MNDKTKKNSILIIIKYCCINLSCKINMYNTVFLNSMEFNNETTITHNLPPPIIMIL